MNIPRTQTLAALAALGIAALALTGCSSSQDDAVAAEPAQQSGEAPAEQLPRGVSGEIAAATDGLLQVQDAETQTAVSYTADTAITQEVAAQLSDIVVGVCITGFGGGDESSEALTDVAIAEPVDGECSAGFGGRGGIDGGMPEGLPEGAEPPEGFEPPADGEMPEGMPEGRFGGISSGMVTAVDGTTITIDAVSMGGEASSQDVLVDDATAFTRTAEATSDALTAGACVVAAGEYSGDRYAATSLAVSEAGDDGCNAGFGGFGGGFPGRGSGDE